MSRTSPSQFEIMVDFMERHGDINRGGDGPLARIKSIQNWQVLTKALNLDKGGNPKPFNRWKKVWSDFKNNTKRKAARIKQAGGNRGEPYYNLTLTDLERRVLKITAPKPKVEVDLELLEEFQEPALPASPAPIKVTVEVESTTEDSNSNAGSSRSNACVIETGDFEAPPITAVQGARGIPLRQNGMARRRLKSERPRIRPKASQVHPATHRFIQSNRRWQQLFKEIATEDLRLREKELEQQAQWQTLFGKCLDIFDKFINK